MKQENESLLLTRGRRIVKCDNFALEKIVSLKKIVRERTDRKKEDI